MVKIGKTIKKAKAKMVVKKTKRKKKK